MLSFNFGDKNSYKDYGILIAKRPSIPLPRRKIQYIDIPGKDSSLRYDEGTYEDITILVECSMVNKEYLPNAIDDIKGWLSNMGEGELIFSFQPTKKYMAQVVNFIDFTQVFNAIGKFPIIFNCRPFKYAVDNDPITITARETTINNIGTVSSEPILAIYGNGDITININSHQVILKNIANKIIVNSVIEDAYNDLGENLNGKVIGEFPRLSPGANRISWSGSVSKIEITPNWRWI